LGPTLAASALGALLGLGVLRVVGEGESQPSNAVMPAPAVLAMAAPRTLSPPPVFERAAPEAEPPVKRTAAKTTNKPSQPSQPSDVAAKVEPRPRTPAHPASKEPAARPAADAAQPKAPALPPPSFAGADLAGEFDRNAAMQALRDAGDRAHACLVRVPSGPLRIAVTFARSGAVEGAVVEGPLAGTAPGACVEAKFRPLRIPPFRGSSLTVRKTIAY
jgi:hypothetical protein